MPFGDKYGFQVEVRTLPNCQICQNETVARFDARLITGQWAYVCFDHYRMYGCGLGMGKAQRLVVRT